ncbi:hypothetical protein [Zavarzinella formosa]|uniref:hypothetical protein n=1 Tax=Zavarzinella formosa TaxID=360055 RepID=UPI0012FADBC4|nr:hypothetical protein [Zavarzinella formosa]
MQVATFAAGIGAALAMLPAFVAVAGAIGTVLAAIASPAGIAIAGIAAIIAAATIFFNFFRGEAPSTADAVSGANKTWTDNVIGFIQKVTVAGATFFNFLMRSAASASDWIAKQFASSYLKIQELWDPAQAAIDKKQREFIESEGAKRGIKPTGIQEVLASMPPIVPPQIDIDRLNKGFEKAKRIANVIADKVKGFFGAGDDDPPGFTRKVNVKFESLQGTFDRLQEAFAKGDGEDIAKKQLDQQIKMVDKLENIVGLVGKLGVGGVGP